ncbi:MAG TPA: deoxyguanosinetriphosphate triphosphohydrolase [Clostridiales bacterium]|nr:deoxyguanosinetriphosphate triphosphohydrolase [Clostridiales bacterium]
MSQCLRKRIEESEHEYLSPYAAFSDQSVGRDRREKACDIRPIYQRDRDRILHSKAFRRLKHKTQVFLAPEGDHYRTRLTHTLEVAQIARTIARALRLNEDLTEAIALAHDLGHTPFGHAGERALCKINPSGFDHASQSLRVVEVLENHGKGLNLTREVRDGIINHQTRGLPNTLEGKIVRLADKIAYINHDIDDAIRAHIMKEEDIPKEFTHILGDTVKERLDNIIHDIVSQSEGQANIIMSIEIEESIYGMREYMFKNVYTNPKAKGEELKVEGLLGHLYKYYMSNTNLLPEEYQNMIVDKKSTKERAVCDYIAGMTDRFATSKFSELTIPKSWGIF